MASSNISVGTKGWADRINTAWQKSAESLLLVGQLLVECKAAVRHGDFGRMLKEELDFDHKTATRLMAISLDRRLSNLANLPILPHALVTLFDLTKLDDAEFDVAMQAGVIHPGMTAKEVPKKQRAPKPKVTEAEYHEVQDAVSTESLGGKSSLAEADGSAAGDREGGDSDVTIPERAAADDLESRELDSGEAQVRLAAAAEPQGEPDRAFQEDPAAEAGAAGGSPASPRGPVPYWTDQLAAGLTMAIRASGEFTPAFAASRFPSGAGLTSEDIASFYKWLGAFERLFRGIALHNAAD